VAEQTGGWSVQRDAHRRGSRRGGCAGTGRGRRATGHRHRDGHAVQGLRVGLQKSRIRCFHVTGRHQHDGVGAVRGHQAVHHQRGEHQPAVGRQRPGEGHH